MDIETMEVGDTVTIARHLRNLYPNFAVDFTVTKIDKQRPGWAIWVDQHGQYHNINDCWQIVDKAVAPW